MKTGQRIDIIKKICAALDQNDISDSNLILRSFGSRTWLDFECSNYEYYIGRTEDIGNDILIELYEYLYPGEQLPSGVASQKSSLWKEGFVKAFISHSSRQKLLATQIKTESASYGIDCFVAHEDIEASKEWRREIRYSLASCDCIITLLTKDFRESNFCDQEVGFALQRGILIVPVSIEMNPYGFMEQFQRITAFEKSPSEIVNEIKTLIERHEVLAPVARQGAIASQKELVKTFLSSSNFGDSTTILKKIEDLALVPEALLREISDGWRKNDQIYGCNGISGRMERLFKKHGFNENL